MKTMLGSRDCARHATKVGGALLRFVAAAAWGASGCAEQDLSIGWQDIGGSEASVGVDANVGVDTSVSRDAMDASVGVDTSSGMDTSVRVDGSPEAGRFVRIWRDDFDTLDPGRWEVAEHTFEENYADFSAANAVAEGGYLKLAVRAKPAGSSGKPYTAAEVRTWARPACGKFLVSARIAPGFGVVSTFFAFHDFFQDFAAQDWNEIVIESSAPSRIDFIYTRKNPSLPGGKDRVPLTDSVPFDATAGFHIYGFEWTPTEVRFLVDGIVEQSLSADVAGSLNRPKRMVMSAYPSTRLAPSRSFDPSVLPVEAWYDWIEVYSYTGLCPTGGVDGGGTTDAGGP
jgi:endo-1,3-1,4-beta-glycanase ExoK